MFVSATPITRVHADIQSTTAFVLNFKEQYGVIDLWVTSDVSLLIERPLLHCQ